MDSAEICFRKAYELRMRGTRIEVVPDILMNLADANNRLGKLDIGAAWYRRALLMCDSLHIASTKKPPIYYGLAESIFPTRAKIFPFILKHSDSKSAI